MNQIPPYLSIAFATIVVLAALLLLRAANWNKRTAALVIAWLFLQTGLSLTGFYTNFSGFPPRVLLLVLPPLLVILSLFRTVNGKRFLDRLDAGTLTLLHLVRIPVELVLWGLSAHHAAPTLITFEGSNFDILSGLSAPLVYYFAFVKGSMGRKGLLVWNLACLLLLANVVTHAFLSAPTALQRFSFDAPFTAVGYFPFTLLPAFVVPVVLLAHLAAIRKNAAAMPKTAPAGA